MWLKRRRRFAVKEKGDPEESGETGIAAAAAWRCLEMVLMLVYLQVSHSQWQRNDTENARRSEV